MEFQDEIKAMLTVKDVARFLNIHTNTVRRWSDNNVLKAYRITPRGDRRFRREDIERFLSKYDEFSTTAKPVENQLSFAF
jgi:excisionase family DNA binding protein